MVTKRQFKSMVNAAVRHAESESPEATQAKVEIWQTVFFDTLQAELEADDQGPQSAQAAKRAVKAIQRYCQPLAKWQPRLAMGIRKTTDWEHYSAELSEVMAQDRLLLERLPQFAWDRAMEHVAAGVPATMAWIEASHYEPLIAVLDHLLDSALASKFKNSSTRYRACSTDRSTAAFWRPLIRTGGGAKYFLTYAVAVAMTKQYMAVSCSVQGRPHNLDPFATPAFLDLLRTPNAIWTERYQPLVAALAYMPVEQRKQFLASLAAQSGALHLTFDEARRLSKATAQQAVLHEKQAATLSKQLAKSEDRAVVLQANNHALLERLRAAAARIADRQPAVDHARDITSYELALRDKDMQVSRLEQSRAEATEQLARTRELLTVLLGPAPGACVPQVVVDHETAPEQWRIVFVGGHERLHTKLRKQMRRAIFLHPDQSQFSSEVFDGVDAVVFSVGYCSHTLAYRAADEVRRRGLRAGYSNFTNVDMVLTEVREILSQRH